MNGLIIVLTCAALLVAGLIGITLSVPLQAPAVILLGLAAFLAGAQIWKSGSAFVPDGDRYISEGFQPWGESGVECSDGRRSAYFYQIFSFCEELECLVEVTFK